MWWTEHVLDNQERPGSNSKWCIHVKVVYAIPLRLVMVRLWKVVWWSPCRYTMGHRHANGNPLILAISVAKFSQGVFLYADDWKNHSCQAQSQLQPEVTLTFGLILPTHPSPNLTNNRKSILTPSKLCLREALKKSLLKIIANSVFFVVKYGVISHLNIHSMIIHKSSRF